MTSRIIPVIDLKDGQVVHAVAGMRSEYRPIQSEIAENSSPEAVVTSLLSRGARELYVADLNAIQQGIPDWASIRTVLQANMNVLLDAGMGHFDAAQQMLRFTTGVRPRATVKFVLGLESFRDREELPRIVAELGSENCCISVDLMNGRLMTKIDAWKNLAPIELAQWVLAEQRIRSLIILDLSRVGTSHGAVHPVLDLCRKLRAESPQLEIFSGGGVRNMSDVEQFTSAGCSGVLVGTAIHCGGISLEQ